MIVCSMALTSESESIQDVVDRYRNLLKVVLDRRPKTQVQCLFGVAELCRKHKRTFCIEEEFVCLPMFCFFFYLKFVYLFLIIQNTDDEDFFFFSSFSFVFKQKKTGEESMVSLFKALYDIEVVLEAAVHAWKKNGATSGEPNFEHALKSVASFINFLETAEEEQ